MNKKQCKIKQTSKTWFDVLTSSPEELAKSLVYEIYVDDKWGTYYKSTIFDNDLRIEIGSGMIAGVGAWSTREEAIEATIKRLKRIKSNI